MDTWLTLWDAEGERTHQTNLTCSRGEDLLDSSCPGRRRQTQPKQTRLRTRGKQTKRRSNTRKKRFCFLLFTIWLVLNLLWLPVKMSSDLQLDLFWVRMLIFLQDDHLHLKWKQAGHWRRCFTRQCICVGAGGIMFQSTCHLPRTAFCNAAPHRDVYSTGCNTYKIFWCMCAILSDSF